MAKTASYPVISLGLDASGITKGLNAARNILKSGMSSLSSAVSTPLFGVALANQAAEFGAKINRLFLEPFRQLMQQEDLFSRFSVLAGGTDKAGKALDQFKGISRATGLSLTELSTSLDTLLQGQFSFSGAVAQIEDLSKVASVLGEGSLPMLTQAAAKFRSNAFVGFEDINSVAASGLPIFEALAQQLNITAEEARGLARNGMITGLQARGALNGAAVMGAGANGGQQEQTLSGVVSRLKEGINQTLAQIGSSVSKVIDVPMLLESFRGFVDSVRVLLEEAFGPLQNVIGGDGGNLKRAFMAAQGATVSALKTIGEGFFKFLEGLQTVTNAIISLVNRVNNLGKVPEGNPIGMTGAISRWWNGPKGPEIEKVNLGANQMRGQFGDLIGNWQKAMAANQGPNQAANELDREITNMNEAFFQAKDAVGQFGLSFKNAMGDPFRSAQDNLMRFNQLMSDAAAAGFGLEEELLAQNMDVAAAIGKQFIDAADGINSKFNEVKLVSALEVNSKEGYQMLARAMTGTPQANVQDRIRLAIERQTDIQKKQRDIAIDTLNVLNKLQPAQQPAPVNF